MMHVCCFKLLTLLKRASRMHLKVPGAATHWAVSSLSVGLRPCSCVKNVELSGVTKSSIGKQFSNTSTHSLTYIYVSFLYNMNVTHNLKLLRQVARVKWLRHLARAHRPKIVLCEDVRVLWIPLTASWDFVERPLLRSKRCVQADHPGKQHLGKRPLQ